MGWCTWAPMTTTCTHSAFPDRPSAEVAGPRTGGLTGPVWRARWAWLVAFALVGFERPQGGGGHAPRSVPGSPDLPARDGRPRRAVGRFIGPGRRPDQAHLLVRSP